MLIVPIFVFSIVQDFTKVNTRTCPRFTSKDNRHLLPFTQESTIDAYNKTTISLANWCTPIVAGQCYKNKICDVNDSFKKQYNIHLRNNKLVTIKKPVFESKAWNSADNLKMRYEWFMKWKDSNVDFTKKNYIFLDEAGSHINFINSWARADAKTPSIVKTTKTKTLSHTITDAIHTSSVHSWNGKKAQTKKRSFKVTRYLQTRKEK